MRFSTLTVLIPLLSGCEAVMEWDGANRAESELSSLVLLHMDAGSETVDSSLHGQSVTNWGATVVGGVFSEGLDFEELEGDFVVISDNSSFAGQLLQEMTVEMRVTLESLPAFVNDRMILASKSGNSGNYGWVMGVKKMGGANSVIFFEGALSSDSTLLTEVRSLPISLSTGVDYHIAVTWNRGQVKFFIDGVLNGTKVIGVPFSEELYDSSADLLLGKQADMSVDMYFDGVMDEFRLSRGLRWAGGFSPPAIPYWVD